MAPSNALSAKGTLEREGLGVAVVLVVSVGLDGVGSGLVKVCGHVMGEGFEG